MSERLQIAEKSHASKKWALEKEEGTYYQSAFLVD